MLYCVYTYVRALSCIVLTHLYSWWRQCVSVTKYEWTNGHFTWWQLTSCENAFSQSCCPDNRHFRGGSGPNQALIRRSDRHQMRARLTPEPTVVSAWPYMNLRVLVNQLFGTNPRTLFTFQFGSRIIPVLSGQDLRKSPASPPTSILAQPTNHTLALSLSFFSTLIGCLALLGETGLFFFHVTSHPSVWDKLLALTATQAPDYS